MTTPEMPARVEAVPGATQVAFPWATATTVLDLLHDAAATLAAHLEARPAMVATIADWTGAYRDAFDEVHARLLAAATATVEAVGLRAGGVITAAHAANDRQEFANQHPEAVAAWRDLRASFG